jgi:hypothetical protein
MNRLNCFALVALGCALFAATQTSANELMNPGFEIDAIMDSPPFPSVTGWTLFNNAAQASATLDPVRTGIGSLQLPGGGGFGVPGAFVTYPAKPGQIWDLQGYMLTKTALSADATFGLLKIVFGDGTGDLVPAAVNIGQNGPAANPGIESLPQMNSASTVNSWQFTHAQGIAPAGTVEVRLFALFVDQSPGTVYFDDLQALLAGDFSNDLSIDGSDLPIWKPAFGHTNLGDADGDNDSDGADFVLWQRQLGNGLPAGGVAAVPEPATLGLLVIAALASYRRRR